MNTITKQDKMILSWNVHYPFFAKNNSYVIGTLENLNMPDIICLQEYVEGSDDKFLFWLKRNGYIFKYFPFAHEGDKSQGILTAVKESLNPKFSITYLRRDKPSKSRPFINVRGIITTRLIISGLVVDIVNIHLTYPRLHTKDLRKREFTSLCDYLNKNRSNATLLCGDFNFVPVDFRRKYLKKQYANFSGNLFSKTWKHNQKFSPLRANTDYLFWNKSQLQVNPQLEEFSTSDHRPLSAIIS